MDKSDKGLILGDVLLHSPRFLLQIGEGNDRLGDPHPLWPESGLQAQRARLKGTVTYNVASPFLFR